MSVPYYKQLLRKIALHKHYFNIDKGCPEALIHLKYKFKNLISFYKSNNFYDTLPVENLQTNWRRFEFSSSKPVFP